MKKFFLYLILMTTVSILFSQYHLLDENFMSGSGEWIFHNGTATNRWVYGNLPSNASISGVPVTSQGVYITNNTSTRPWAYTSSNGNAAKVYIAREVEFPDNATDIRLSFRWAAVGRSANDYMRVYLAPAGFTPTVQSGTVTGIGPTNLELYEQYQIGDARYNLVNTWTTTTINLAREMYAGTTQTLMFAWRNDIFGAANPPVAIDYIRIDHDILPPHALTYIYPPHNATDVYTRTRFQWSYPETGHTPTSVFLTVSSTPDMSDLSGVHFGIVLSNDTNEFLLPADFRLEPMTEYYWQVTPTIDMTSLNNQVVYKFTTMEHIDPPVAAITPVPVDDATNISRLPILSWSYPSDGSPVDEFLLLFSDEPTFANPLISELLDFSQFSFEILEKLDFETVYYWQVIPINVEGECETPNTWSFTTEPLLPPPLVTYLSPVENAQNLNYQPTFRWEYTESDYTPTHIKLTISKFNDMTSPVYTSIPTDIPYPDTLFRIAHGILEEDTQYYWQVTPVNSAGDPANPIVWSFKTAEQILPPAAATLIYPTNAATDIPHDDQLVFEWSYSETDPFVDSFIFIISESPTIADTLWWFDFEDGEMETDLPILLVLNKAYYWRVVTKNTEGATPSAIYSFTTWPVPRARPLKVTLLEPDYAHDDVLVLPTFRWAYDSASYPATEITLSIYTDIELSDLYFDITLPATETEYTLLIGDILTINTDYWWQAIPSNDQGEAIDNDTFFFRTELSWYPPGQAIPIQPEDGEELVSTTLTLVWDYDDLNEQPILHFDLKFGLDPDMIDNMIEESFISPSTRTFMIEITLELYTDYYWQVIPWNKQLGPIGGADIWTFKTEPFLPDPVTLISPAHNSTDIEVMSTYIWGHATTGDTPVSYLVEVATDEDFTDIVDSREIEHPGAMYSSALGLQSDSYYFWRVIPYNEHGYPGKNNAIAKFKTRESVVGGTGDPKDDDEFFEIPFGFSNDHYYSQSIYTAAQIGRVGIITDIAWMVGDTPIENIDSNITIYMANVMHGNFSGTADWVSPIPPSSYGFVKVYEGPLTISNKNENTWIEYITLSTPFMYNGMTNLMIAVKQSNSDNQTLNFRVFDSGSTSATLSIANDVNPLNIFNVINPANIGVGELSKFLPRIRLTMSALPPIAPPGSAILVSPADGTEGVSENTVFKWRHPEVGGLPPMYIIQFSLYPDFRVYDWVSFVFLPGTEYIYRSNASGGLKDGQLYYWRVNSFSYAGTKNGDEVWTFTTNKNVILDSNQPETDATPIIREANVFNQFYDHTYNQSIYRASHIKTAGEITDISFMLFDIDIVGMYTSNIKIYMAHTTKSVFNNDSDWITPSNSTDWTMVYDGPINLNPTMVGPQFISLQNRFEYNGTDNLLIATHRNVSSPHDVYIYHFKYTTTVNNSSLSARSFSNSIDINDPPTLDAPNIIIQTSNYLPSMFLKLEPDPIGFKPPIPPVSTELKLSNFPNPFNPETVIYYEVPSDGEVTIEIYNIKGQKVKTLVSGYHRTGEYDVVWSGRDDDGRIATSGVYLYRMTIGDKSTTKKMVLLK
jgi:hypothetical protein